jgi:hypothetical protein
MNLEISVPEVVEIFAIELIRRRYDLINCMIHEKGNLT